ncbi:MAG: histidine phosphatase family protein [Bacteroidetes bacterium]|nr:histidine phosphatase family protein [Bacteroidota bacterium]
MKTLYFIRHAKSSWDYPELSDEERPLIEKGIKRTSKIAHYLAENNVIADIIISSHAERALQTAKIIAKKINYQDNKIIIDKNIYGTNIDRLFTTIFSISNEYHTAIIFGHNPTFTNIANYFLDEKIDNLPTSGLVCVEFDTDEWNTIVNVSRLKCFVIRPKELMKVKK